MAPKKATPSKAKASASTAPQHASYQDMIKEAIVNLKERNGSSRQAIKKYIQANNTLGATTEAAFNSHLARALKTGEENGVFERPKGASGPVKLKKPAAKPAAAAPAKATKPKTEKKPAAPKKAAGAKKAAVPKKAAKPAAPKKATKPKANASKPRAKKSEKTAPAVEEKPPVVLGKTKSGRVTKSRTTPQSSSKPAKKAAPKKAPAKKATPKKSTPKKAEA